MLKLSDAIRQGAVGMEQTRNETFNKYPPTSCCALGAAVISSGCEQVLPSMQGLKRMYPILKSENQMVLAPFIKVIQATGRNSLLVAEQLLINLIAIANDNLRLSFGSIADLVQQCEEIYEKNFKPMPPI